MNYKLRSMLIICIAALAIGLSSFWAGADENLNVTDPDIVETVAKNEVRIMRIFRSTYDNTTASAINDKWDNTTVVHKDNLYGFDGRLVGYSIDVKNNNTGEKAFVILSNNKENEPVLEFASGTYSPYTVLIPSIYSGSDYTCLYSGTLGYYVKCRDSKGSGYKYYDLHSKAQMDDSVIQAFITYDKGRVHKSNNTAAASTQWKRLSSNHKTQEYLNAVSPVPNGYVLIGNTAYDINYANDNANKDKIRQVIADYNRAIYIKNFEGKWVDNSTNEVAYGVGWDSIEIYDKDSEKIKKISEVINADPEDIVKITIRKGNNGKMITINNKDELLKIADYLDSISIKRRDRQLPSNDYQYMVTIYTVNGDSTLLLGPALHVDWIIYDIMDGARLDGNSGVLEQYTKQIQ